MDGWMDGWMDDPSSWLAVWDGMDVHMVCVSSWLWIWIYGLRRRHAGDLSGWLACWLAVWDGCTYGVWEEGEEEDVDG